MLALHDAVIHWKSNKNDPPVLHGVNVEAPRGMWISVIGRNGSGKSTLLLALAGLLPLTRGTLTVDGAPLGTGEAKNPCIRLVLGRPEHQIIGSTAAEDIAWGLQLVRLPATEIRRRTREALEVFDLGDVGDRPVHLLSGGQLQRLALAGAWAARPGWILLDEPTSMLDPDHREQVLELLAALRDEGIGIIQTTHSLEETWRADRAWLVHDQRVFPLGPPKPALREWRRFAAAGFPKPWKWQVVDRLAELGHRRLDYGARWTALAREMDLSATAGVLPRPSACDPRLPQPAGQDPSPVLRAPGAAVRTPVAALDRVIVGERLEIGRCEFQPGITAVLGSSGAGKTTLLAVLTGLLRPDAGTYRIPEGVPHGNSAVLAALRRTTAMALQFPEQQLFAPTVYEDVAYALRRRGLSPPDVDRRIRVTARELGIDHLLQRSPFTLSFGEQRKTALAVVLALEPRLLALDEPFAGIDPPGRRALALCLQRWAARTGATLVVATHQIEELLGIADRWVLLHRGRLLAAGSLALAAAGAAQLESDNPDAAARLRVAALWTTRGATGPVPGVPRG
ncbi:MAG: ATP-binding cassette domain-containing protein [Kyrpidia sp.]|nr:ATP-binding cassette domain-containing protein [Kyrpidia sp.]